MTRRSWRADCNTARLHLESCPLSIFPHCRGKWHMQRGHHIRKSCKASPEYTVKGAAAHGQPAQVEEALSLTNAWLRSNNLRLVTTQQGVMP